MQKKSKFNIIYDKNFQWSRDSKGLSQYDTTYLIVRDWLFFSMILGARQRRLLLPLGFNIVWIIMTSEIKTKINNYPKGNMAINIDIKNSMRSTKKKKKKILEWMYEISQATEYRINIQKLIAFLCNSNR